LLRFLASLTALAVLFLLTLWLGSIQAWWTLPFFWKEIIIFIFLTTTFIVYKLGQIKRDQPAVFVQFYLLSIVIKRLASLTFIFFIAWKAPKEVTGHAALFITGYLLFTALEVIFLMRQRV